MFNVISKLKSDKRGFTLTEVLVTMTILLIALTLMGQLIPIIVRQYRSSEYRWIAQTMAEAIASSLSSDSGLEALGTADVVEIMCEEPTLNASNKFSLEACPELGEFTYDTETHNLTIVPDEDLKDELLKGYIYYFSFNEFLYRIHYSDVLDVGDDTTAGTLEPKTAVITPITDKIVLYDANEVNTKAGIEFAIARNTGDYNTTTHQENFQNATSYLTSSITANVNVRVANKGDDNIASKADMNVSLYMNNMAATNKVNYQLGGNALANKFVAGWTKNDAGVLLANAPTETALDGVGASEDDITRPANIVRYHSVNTPLSLKDSTQSGGITVGINVPVCFFTSLTIGSNRRPQILEPLRDFRDTVLRGNTVGEWVIDKYYDWSPTVIGWTEKSPALKSALMVVSEGLAAFATVAVE